YLRTKLEKVDADDSGVALKAEQQRARALSTIGQEERELLTMRMRQLITDGEFNREREVLRSARQELENTRTRAVQVNFAVTQRKTALLEALDLAGGLRRVIAHGTPTETREVLTRLHLEITLRERRLAFTAHKPL